MMRQFISGYIRSLSACRNYHCSSNNMGKSYTRESIPVPGSESHLNPDGWAKRLFKLHKHKDCLSKNNDPNLLLMVCRLQNLKGVPHYHKAILEKYGLGRDIKVSLYSIKYFRIILGQSLKILQPL